MTDQRLIVECFDGRDGFYWRLVHTNGQEAAVSEAYRRKFTRDRIASRLAKLGGFALRDE